MSVTQARWLALAAAAMPLASSASAMPVVLPAESALVPA
jgi:hypothetical protein